MSEDSRSLTDSMQCLALDMGGVVCADTWEALVLTPETGLAAIHGLERDRIHAIGTELWHRYAYAEHDERDYWRDWERALGLAFDPASIEQLYATQCWTDPSAAGLVEQCLDRGLQVAIVSNSTSFWFPRQMQASGLDRFADRLNLYLSHRTGFAKTHEQGGLALLARKFDPAATLFMDDRAENLACAKALAMRCFAYERGHNSLRACLESLLNPANP